LLSLLATSCSAPPVPLDPQRSDVVAERGPARIATAGALASMTRPYGAESSATIDSCAAGEDNWKVRDPWSYRCWFAYSGVAVVPDLTAATAMVTSGLIALDCEDPHQLAQQLSQWGELNPGEPLPTDPDFQPGVVPPQLDQCRGIEVWVRFSSATDPLLAVVAADAASTRDPLVVRANPFSDAQLQRLRARDDGVIVFVTVRMMYHQEPR